MAFPKDLAARALASTAGARAYARLLAATGIGNPDRLRPIVARAADPNRRRLFHVALMKTGSTFLTRILRRELERDRSLYATSLPFAYGRAEQEIYWPRLLPAVARDTFVSHLHVKASEIALEAVRVLNMKVVVQTRDLGDILVSLRDHVVKERDRIPAVVVDGKQFAGWSRQRQGQFMVDMAAPWLIGIYASWYRAAQDDEAEVLWVGFDEAVTATTETACRILTFGGFDPDEASVRATVDAVMGDRPRFNKGVPGRGREELTAAQWERLAALAGHYPDVDFGPLGI